VRAYILHRTGEWSSYSLTAYSTARSIYMRQDRNTRPRPLIQHVLQTLVSESVVHIAHINAQSPQNANKEHTPCGQDGCVNHPHGSDPDPSHPGFTSAGRKSAAPHRKEPGRRTAYRPKRVTKKQNSRSAGNTWIKYVDGSRLWKQGSESRRARVRIWPCRGVNAVQHGSHLKYIYDYSILT
jgi:hypothetical protein